MRRVTRWLLLAIAVFWIGAPADAADTGTMSGAVFDVQGAPVAGATVRVSGDSLPVGRTIETDGNGAYRVEYLPPGDYLLEIEKAGVGTSRRRAVIGVGRDTQVDVILGTAVAESLTVEAVTPLVDTRSTEVSFNVKADTLNSLSVERTYRGLFQLIPGVGENRSNIGPAAGGSRQDNTYLIDGANITNPNYGYLGTEINELDIAEVNLKRAGISAEFGRASGSVINAVSRSGTNRFSGLARIGWMPQGLVSGYELPDDLRDAGVRPGTFRDQVLTSELSPAFGIGGPIVRDHAFFYGSARYFSQSKWDRVNKVGTPLPDEVRTGHELYAKINATPTTAHQLTASFRQRPNEVENAGLTSDYAPSVGVISDNGGSVGTAEWAYFMAPTRSLDVRYLRVTENNDDTPVTALGLQPRFDPRTPAAMGQYTDTAQANLIVGANQYGTTQNYRRHEVRATVTQFFDLGMTSHAVKAGAGWEVSEELLNRAGNGWGIIAPITVNGVPALRARYFTPQPPQVGQARTGSIFLQDEMTVAKRLAVNVGVLLSRDQFSQVLDGSNGCPSTVQLKGGAAVYESNGDRCDFLRFGFGDEVQPRLGVSYQLRDAAGDKAYAHWGRYYNMDLKSSGRSLAPSRIFQTETVFDLNGNVLSSGPFASTTGKMIDPDIEPIYTDEMLIGYATPLWSSRYTLDVFFMSRSMNNMIEDLPSRLSGSNPTSGPYVAANLPCTRFAACQLADARREYKAATVDVRRQLSDGWMADVSYTWSRFEGNFDLDYSTSAVFNTSSFIQDAPGANVEDVNRAGPLFEDRPHVVKVFSSYAVTDRLMASGFFRTQSGTPWAARARDGAGAVLNYLEPAGSHRNPTWSNLDLMAAYRLPLGDRRTLSLEARVLNVFDNQTQLSTDAQQYLDLRTLTVPPFFQPYQQLNPFFGTGNNFAPPRRLYLAATASF